MKRLIIPIFIMNRGCPNRCIFCNERIAAGNHPARIDEKSFRSTVDAFLSSAEGRFGETQIAFYGGNFTGLDEENREELLDFALPYLEDGSVDSLRLSTRPDHLDRGILRRLFSRQVRTIEIGAQSLDEEVLSRSGRNHGADDVRRAVALLRDEGFETGIHLMAGLPGDSANSFLKTIEETATLCPDTVRIHPTLVFRDTDLERQYLEGLYHPLSLDEAVNMCTAALIRLTMADIPVIRLGLHITEEMLDGNNLVAGPFHPAFRSLVEERIFRQLALLLIDQMSSKPAKINFFLSPSDVSSFRGLNNGTIDFLQKFLKGASLSVSEDRKMKRHSLRVVAGEEVNEISLISAGDRLFKLFSDGLS